MSKSQLKSVIHRLVKLERHKRDRIATNRCIVSGIKYIRELPSHIKIDSYLYADEPDANILAKKTHSHLSLFTYRYSTYFTVKTPRWSSRGSAHPPTNRYDKAW